MLGCKESGGENVSGVYNQLLPAGCVRCIYSRAIKRF
jgi:hypothetical protein